MKDKLYSIGEMAKLCSVSQRTLRYYDKIGLLKATEYNEDSGYRYYDYSAISKIKTIKYYQESGVSLELIGQYLKADSLDKYLELFDRDIKEKENNILQLETQIRNLKEWRNLIEEGKKINFQKLLPVTICKMRRLSALCAGFQVKGREEIFPSSLRDKALQYDLVAFGPVYYEFPNYQKVLNNEIQISYRYMEIEDQIGSCNGCDEFGGFSAISGIHKGSTNDILVTYRKIIKEAEDKGLCLRGDVIERGIIDYTTTDIEKLHITEIMFPLAEDE